MKEVLMDMCRKKEKKKNLVEDPLGGSMSSSSLHAGNSKRRKTKK
jgi:hypothetical protein